MQLQSVPGEEDQDFDVLPVESFKEAILHHLRSSVHQVLICVGETGSGKTTKIPQIVLDSGILGDLGIAVTQPRRVGAMTVSQRVASERGGRLGEQVGYRVRFDDRTGPDTRIFFLTDGILVRECTQDPTLSKYKVVMLDEAHERSVHTDILFGLLKKACRIRPDLRVLITSATLDTAKFVQYFDGAPALNIPGRVFPVDLYHSKLAITMTASGPATNAYVRIAAETALEIHRSHDPESGHILIFLTGQEEIERCCALLSEEIKVHEANTDRGSDIGSSGRRGVGDGKTDLLILPLHGSLRPEQQRVAFLKAPRGVRKCIVSTNIAETSVTVPHVKFVVDAGYVKQKAYDPERHLESLVVVPVSHVAAQQRAGRAGRTGPGECYRLYSSESYNSLLPESIPEIRRCSMAGTVLTLKALGIQDVIGFDFIDHPSLAQMEEALTQLYYLGAICGEGSEIGTITSVGREMSRLPLEPMLGRMLVEASLPENNCFFELSSIVAMLSATAEEVFIRPNGPSQCQHRGRDGYLSGKRPRSDIDDEEQELIRLTHAKLRHVQGDHFTFVRLMCAFDRQSSPGNNDKGFQWCRKNFLRFRSLRMAVNIRDQLLRSAKSQLSSRRDASGSDGLDASDGLLMAAISRCLVTAMFMNAARMSASEDLFRTIPLFSEFDGLDRRVADDVKLVHLHPTSSLTKENITAAKAVGRRCEPVKHEDIAPSAEFVIYQDLLFSSRLYIRQVTAISAYTLRKMRCKVQFVSSKTLSGDGSVDSLQSDKELRGAPSDENSSVFIPAKKADVAPISNDKINDAKARYLARKRMER